MYWYYILIFKLFIPLIRSAGIFFKFFANLVTRTMGPVDLAIPDFILSLGDLILFTFRYEPTENCAVASAYEYNNLINLNFS